MSDRILNGLDPQAIERVFDTEYLPVTRANINHLAVLVQQGEVTEKELRAELEKIRVALRGYSDSDLVSLAEATQTRLTAAELILENLCDMVLGADAADRSDGALVRAVGELECERDAAITECIKRNKERAEQAEADARLLAQMLYQSQSGEGFELIQKYLSK